MTVELKQLHLLRVVSSQLWVREGKDLQDAEWGIARLRWCQYLQEGGWQTCEEPRETIEFDEELREVRLYIRGAAQREAGNIIDAPHFGP